MTEAEQQELLGLIAEVIDGDLRPESRDRLREILKGSPEARELYRDHLEIHAQLHLDYDGGQMLEDMPGARAMESAPESERKVIRWDWAFAAGVAAVLLLFLNVLVRQTWDSGRPAWESGAQSVAVVTKAVQAGSWDEGQELAPGFVELASGLVQIEFFGGASVILEGPARLELIDSERAFLHAGKLRALVPVPAQGFVIETQDFQTVDLGTEFAMEVSELGGEVHVLDGEVELQSRDSTWESGRFLGGESRRIAKGGVPEPIDLRPTDFVSREELQLLATGQGRERYTQWQAQSRELQAREDVLAYYTFEGHQSWDRSLKSAAGDQHGAIVGAQWSQGRWPGKGALEFRRISDRVRLNIPGEYEALTMVAWVRVEGFDQWLSSLLLTDAFDPGEVHWQISDSGELILGVSAAEPHNSFSPPVLSPRDLGRWLHLAVTVDRAQGRVIHYLDGETVSSHEVNLVEPLRIGGAEIGNWRSLSKQSHPLRSLNGTVDEFLILSSSLHEDDIHQLYETGNPYR